MIDLVRLLKQGIAATRRPRSTLRSSSPSFFSTFSPAAREALSNAQKEARSLGHDFLGTEHLLLGLLDNDHGVAATALHNLGITRALALREIERTVGHGSHWPRAPMPLTVRCKRVLQLATEEARRSNRPQVDTGHLLLALLLEREGVAALVLQALGVTPPKARHALLQAQTRDS
ncbi:MAG: Clp protease N-terminal domain-containing protein [Chloroflexia bacterium]